MILLIAVALSHRESEGIVLGEEDEQCRVMVSWMSMVNVP